MLMCHAVLAGMHFLPTAPCDLCAVGQTSCKQELRTCRQVLHTCPVPGHVVWEPTAGVVAGLLDQANTMTEDVCVCQGLAAESPFRILAACSTAEVYRLQHAV